MKRKIAILLALSMALLSACQESAEENNESTAEVSQSDEKPPEISMLTNTFMPWEDSENDVQMFCSEYEKLTGIKLKVEIPESKSYYERLNILLATDSSVDLFETGSLFYPNYAKYDLLWDMTDAWENSSIKDITNENYVNALKIDGRLYGFPLNAGNGTVTYVRKDWLDKLNISEPKNYDEFNDMLKKFKTIDENVIPITAAGLVNSEAPYNLYLREFYQNASPDFYIKDGKYVDGMTEPEMEEALKRMKKAKEDGLLDPDIATNKTSDCRNKFYAGTVGCFNYWAGTWGRTLDKKIKELDPNGEVVSLKPIEGVKYLERPPLAMVISKTSKYPKGVFKYLIEFSHDCGEGQMLFTNGIENYNWKRTADNKIERITEHEVDAIYLKTDLSINNFDDPMPKDPQIEDELKMFYENSELAPIPAASKDVGSLFSEIDIIRREIIESVVMTDMTVEEGLAEYNKRASKLVTRVLNNLNSENSVIENKNEEE